jgi:hypothetical protein
VIIADAINAAATEYVVCFLLMAYVEARVHGGRFDVPEQVKRLPIRHQDDVDGRLRALRDVFNGAMDVYDGRAIREALDVFAAASDRLFVVRQPSPVIPEGGA